MTNVQEINEQVAALRQALRANEQALDAAETQHGAPLKTGGGGGTSSYMEPASKEYVDLKTALTSAQNDARFAEVLAEMKALGDAIRGKPSTWQMVGAVFAGAATILGVLLAALSFGGDRFDGGVGLADQRQEQLQRDADQDAIIKRLDALLASQAKPDAPAPGTPSE